VDTKTTSTINAVTASWRRRRVAVGCALDSKPGGEWPTDDQDPSDASKSPLRAGPTPADSAPWWRVQRPGRAVSAPREYATATRGQSGMARVARRSKGV